MSTRAIAVCTRRTPKQRDELLVIGFEIDLGVTRRFTEQGVERGHFGDRFHLSRQLFVVAIGQLTRGSPLVEAEAPGLVSEVAPDLTKGAHIPQMLPTTLGPSDDVIRDERRRRSPTQARFQELRDRVKHLRHDGMDQVPISNEMVGDFAFAHTGAWGDHTHRHALESEIDDRVDYAIQQQLASHAPGKRAGIPGAIPINTHSTLIVRAH